MKMSPKVVAASYSVDVDDTGAVDVDVWGAVLVDVWGAVLVEVVSTAVDVDVESGLVEVDVCGAVEVDVSAVEVELEGVTVATIPNPFRFFHRIAAPDAGVGLKLQ
jgi:hypothetical protein